MWPISKHTATQNPLKHILQMSSPTERWLALQQVAVSFLSLFTSSFRDWLAFLKSRPFFLLTFQCFLFSLFAFSMYVDICRGFNPYIFCRCSSQRWYVFFYVKNQSRASQAFASDAMYLCFRVSLGLLRVLLSSHCWQRG